MAAEIPELISFFRQQNFVRKFPASQVICSQSDRFEYVYLVDSGMAKSYDIDENGVERTLNIFGRANIFPLTWLLSNPPAEHIYYYEAFSNTTCYIAHKDDLLEFTRKNPQVMTGLADYVTRSYIALAGRVRNLERSQVRERLEYVLWVLANNLGTFNGHVAQIDWPVTQEDISKLAGVTRESISLEMNAQDTRDIMWKSGRDTFIDVSKLSLSNMPAIW